MYLPNVLTRYQFLLGTKIWNSLKCIWYFSCCGGHALAVSLSSSMPEQRRLPRPCAARGGRSPALGHCRLLPKALLPT